MAITKDSNRQYPLIATVDVGFADLTETVAAEAIDLPVNAVVVGGRVVVTEVFNSTTSDVVIVGDGGDTNRYTATAIDLTALGSYALDGGGDVLTVITTGGYKYTAPDTLDVIWTAGTASTATTGAFTLEVLYYVDGKGQENQG